jgi:hypothetical protein
VCSYCSISSFLCRSLFILLIFFYWPLCCQSFFDLRLITLLVSFGHCVVSPSLIYVWLPFWYLLAIVLSVLLWFMSDYPFGNFWPLCCQSFFDLCLITLLVSFGYCVVSPSLIYVWLPFWYLFAFLLSVLLWFTSDYPFGIFWPLCCLSFFDLRLITLLVSFGHCVVSPSLIYVWLPFWYLQTFLTVEMTNYNIKWLTITLND